MVEKEQHIADERLKAANELEKKMKNQLDEQQKIQMFKKIDQDLQEIVPKISEINTICREIGRETVFYEPEIVTEVQADGTKVSRVIVKVYPDRTDREESGMIPWDDFLDTVYEKVKELYDEAEENNFDPDTYDMSNDG